MNNNFLPVSEAHTGKVNSVSGLEIDLNNPNPDNINIDDIATGLSNTCRFGGQIRRHYSVAQHSLLVIFLAPVYLKRAALMHDAAEAYINDITKPQKILMGEPYAILEARFMDVIGKKYGITEEEIKAVKPYDQQAYEIEHQHIRLNNDEAWNAIWKENNLGFQSYDENPKVWKALFMKHFNELFNN